MSNIDGLYQYSLWREKVETMLSDNSTEVEWHAVVDPNADGNMLSTLRQLFDSSDMFPLFMNTMNYESTKRGPWFININGEKKFIEWFFTQSANKPIGILYQAYCKENDRLYEHLQNLIECSLPGKRKGVFRFYDPRILYALCQCGDEKLKPTIVGPAVEVHAWEPGFEQAILLSGKKYFQDQQDFFIEQSWLDCVSKQTTPYAVLQNMQGENGKILRAKPQKEALCFVSDICGCLFSLGLTDIHSCITGTSFAMQMGRNLFADERVQKVIQENIAEHSLKDILERFPDARV